MSDRVEIILNRAGREEATRLIRSARKGSRVTICGPQRTLEQNTKIRAMLGDIAAQAKWQGQEWTVEQWKDLFTSAAVLASSASGDQHQPVAGLEGGILIFGRRTSELSIEEASDLITYMTGWAEANGVVLYDSPASAVVAA